MDLGVYRRLRRIYTILRDASLSTVYGGIILPAFAMSNRFGVGAARDDSQHKFAMINSLKVRLSNENVSAVRSRAWHTDFFFLIGSLGREKEGVGDVKVK